MGHRPAVLGAWAVLGLGRKARGLLPPSLGFAATTPPQQPPNWSKLLRQQKQKMAARRRGEQFVKAIPTHPFETLPHHTPTDASGAGDEKEEEEGVPEGAMRLWHNIPDLYTGHADNIVLRSISEPFWQSCIDTVEDVFPDDRERVCAVGTPGTGNTCTTPLLLRMLLLKNSTVVYIRKSINCSYWFYELVPDQTATNVQDGKIPYTVNVYPEKSTVFREIPSLRKPFSYYVVDPGTSKGSCDPKPSFKARVIIISSPHEQHWGANEFQKEHADQTGKFHYSPLWNLNEVLCGLNGFNSDEVRLSPQQVAERYREVGGVPENLLADTEEYQNILETQDNAVEAIEPEEARRIVSGEMDPIGHLNNGRVTISLILSAETMQVTSWHSKPRLTRCTRPTQLRLRLWKTRLGAEA